MSKDFKCEVCRKSSERLHMRDQDGKWVCAYCIPERELDACQGLRERLGLRVKRVSLPKRKAA
jgi:ribosomal protein L37AE/L43A